MDVGQLADDQLHDPKYNDGLLKREGIAIRVVGHIQGLHSHHSTQWLGQQGLQEGGDLFMTGPFYLRSISYTPERSYPN